MLKIEEEEEFMVNNSSQISNRNTIKIKSILEEEEVEGSMLKEEGMVEAETCKVIIVMFVENLDIMQKIVISEQIEMLVTMPPLQTHKNLMKGY